MKRITNWREASVCDLESDGLLDQATEIHTLGVQLEGKDFMLVEGGDHNRLKGFLLHHINNNIPVVFHNGICFDIPLLEQILEID